MSDPRVTARPWEVEVTAGRASAFHAREVPAAPGRLLWVFRPTVPALVLGSTQRPQDTLVPGVGADAGAGAGAGEGAGAGAGAPAARAAAADPALDVAHADSVFGDIRSGRIDVDSTKYPPGVQAAGWPGDVDVVRRRSGGGVVWLAPGEVLWVDVIVPAGDPLWDDDIGRAFVWLGDALAPLLGQRDTVVHRGPLVPTPWSRLVCFAGVGSGEITVGGRKVVGIAQRRTRSAARFQVAVLGRWDPAPYSELLAARPPVAALAEVAVGAARPLGVIERDLLESFGAKPRMARRC